MSTARQTITLVRTATMVWLAATAAAWGAYRVRHGVLIGTRLNDGNDNYGGGAPSVMVSIPQGTRDFTVPDANRGDYNLTVGLVNANARGVLFTCVAENGRDEGDGLKYATSAVDLTGDQFFIPVSQSPAGIESNSTIAAAYFEFAEGWIAGYAKNAANNGEMTTLIASSGLNLGTEFVDNASPAGVYTLTIPGVNSRSDGVLLVCGGANEDNYALSAPEADGSWTIYCHDNGANGASYENDDVVFVYIPVTQPGVVCGRILGDGTSQVGSGGYSVENVASGTYVLTIAGAAPTRGTLLVSPEGGDANNADNIITYAPDAAGWRIQTHDIAGMGLQTMPAGERVFSFAYFPYTQKVPRARIGERVYHGRIDIVQNDAGNNEASVTESLASGTELIEVVGGNRGDIDVKFGPYLAPRNGVAITCVRELSRDNTAQGDTIGEFYATSAIQAADSDTRFFIPVFRAPNGDEVNINVAVAYFPFREGWTAGYAYNTANGAELTGLYASDTIVLGSQFVDHGDGTNTLNIPGINGLTDGVLLVCGGKNEDNYTLSMPKPDGAFLIINHDNGANGTSYERDPVAFVFIPTNQPNAIVGRILGDGSAEVGDSSTFTAVHTGVGTWQLTINGYRPGTGTLIVSPEGGDNYNVDNIVSYGELDDRWIIESRDLAGMGLQSMASNGERCFSFAFFPYPDAAPPATVFSLR